MTNNEKSNILAENMRRFATKNLNEQANDPQELEKILVKNFLKFKYPAKVVAVEKEWMPKFTSVDGIFELLGQNVDQMKKEYEAWLVKNGFRTTDVYVDTANALRVRQQIQRKQLK